ncbi:NAD(P)H-binding protein [Nocardia sp. NPDC003482]
MRIVIAGGHGKIALLLAGELSRRGDEVHSLIRKTEQSAEVAATGAKPVLLDLEHAAEDEVLAAVTAADAAVFAAGAGAGSGVARKYTVDRDGSIRLARAAEQAGVRRFLQISSMGAGQAPDPSRDEVWAAYIDAKTQAENDLHPRRLDWTILRPGRLTDTEPTHHITLTPPPAPYGSIPRADVATVLADLLPAENTHGKTLELISGDTPIPEAIRALT